MVFCAHRLNPFYFTVSVLLIARLQPYAHAKSGFGIYDDCSYLRSKGKKPGPRCPTQTTSNGYRSGDVTESEQGSIAGVTNAAEGEFPYFVQGQGCDASLIWYDLALTAAHCYGTAFNDEVYIGNSVLNSVEGGALTRSVVQQERHPNFNSDTMDNDLMLVKLNSEVPRTGTIQPIQINSVDSVPDLNDPLMIIGFGAASEGGGRATNLNKAEVNYVDPTTCNAAYGDDMSSTLMLCATASGIDTCLGDAGGPIVNAQGVQVGVSSFGTGCARTGIPGVYARTSGGYDWIRSQVCLMASNPPSYCGTTIADTAMHSVVITVQNDQSPEEISWELTDSTGQAVESQAASSIVEYSALVQKQLSLPAGTYTFTIADSGGDGMCCEYGNGYFNITVDGTTVVSSDGVFGNSTQSQFTIAPQRSYGALTMTGGGRGKGKPNKGQYTPPPPMWSGIEDRAQTGGGKRKEKPNKNQYTPSTDLWSSTAEYARAQPNPTACSDDENGAFAVNQAIGQKGCDWLRGNQVNFGYLCELVRVATVCPVTCNFCGSD